MKIRFFKLINLNQVYLFDLSEISPIFALMKMIGIVTGDLLQSSSMTIEFRQKILEVIKERIKPLISLMQKESGWMKIEVELYRGDRFQVVVPDIAYALRVAIYIRASLLKLRGDDGGRCDARIGLGIGTCDLETAKILESDGEAFRNAGYALDGLKKDRLAIRTPWADVNAEFKLSTAFADQLVTSWTAAQAEVLSVVLRHPKLTQRESAKYAGKSVKLFNSHYLRGNAPLIKQYLDRYETCIRAKKDLYEID